MPTNRIPFNKFVAPIAVIMVGVIGSALVNFSHAGTCLDTSPAAESSSACVKYAQTMLNGLSANWDKMTNEVNPVGSQIAATGTYDVNTVARVTIFQRIASVSTDTVKVTGSLDTSTWQQLCDDVATLGNDRPSQQLAHQAAESAGCQAS